MGDDVGAGVVDIDDIAYFINLPAVEDPPIVDVHGRAAFFTAQ